MNRLPHKYIYLGQPGLTETGIWECAQCGKRNPKNGSEWYGACVPDAPNDPEGQAALLDETYDARQFQTKPRTLECPPVDSNASSGGEKGAREGTPTAPGRPSRFPTREVAGNIKAPPAVTPVTGGVKLDQGKARWDLLPYDALDEVAHVLRFGAQKYAPRNWELGMDWGRLHAAAERHLSAWAQNQDNDPETGMSHLAHAATCILMLLALTKRGEGNDDRGDTCLT